ncbi:toll/interleukin-1 receptor domain-containing protein [uncultured Prevotella sp.]|uniref:toll/interleukin-1 receptor domain-containing protein n=1 Tax=uncultured Prevotella sp. TaxID=159272 RepID=UPI0025D4AA63|nr:toll/interleukin-1 receptor domain-containing protein [uncultured Prevotella sp.]
MPKDFSFKDFLSAFKECYPCQWEDIVRYCKEKKNDFYRRSRKGLRSVPYYTPEQYLKHAVHMHSLSKYLDEQDRHDKYASLVLKGQKKKKRRNDKLTSNLVFVQEVCPPYIKKLIKSYFKTRKTYPLDINARYLILLEATQFRCDETIEFLNKISACEKNNDLRQMAFYSLQRLGENPWLPKKRKGKRRLSMLKPIDIQKNPTELIQLIYTNQHMLYQEYDIFISHSSLDVNELLQLKVLLNQQGKTVYIDWVNDRIMLNRQNQNQDTWKAIELRMDQSKTLLYVMTDNSIKSPYTEREVMYFKNASKSVKVYKPYPVSLPTPNYLDGCNFITKEQLHNL